MKDGKYVVLCIDDDPDFLETSTILLEANDFIVVTSPSAEEGLQKYKDSNPDLVIVDLMMEEVDSGTNFARELKALGNAAPVYMLSSIGDQLDMTVDPVELGISGIFQKPLDVQRVISTIRAVLGG